MSFEWMEVSASNRSQGPIRQVVLALQEKAALLKRLGYDASYATSRCLSDFDWHFEGVQNPPMRRTDVKKLVKNIFRS